MNLLARRMLFWSPRILCILFAAFLSMFALDVFDEGRGFWKTVVALLIHLIPTYVVVLALVVAWRREWIGAILFVVLAVFYLFMAWGRFPWVAYLSISGPLFLTGVLFLFNWRCRTELRSHEPRA